MAQVAGLAVVAPVDPGRTGLAAGNRCLLYGYRSGFRDWTTECTDALRKVRELALAHVNSNQVEATCRRSDLFEKRRAFMAEWADCIAPIA